MNTLGQKMLSAVADRGRLSVRERHVLSSML